MPPAIILLILSVAYSALSCAHSHARHEYDRDIEQFALCQLDVTPDFESLIPERLPFNCSRLSKLDFGLVDLPTTQTDDLIPYTKLKHVRLIRISGHKKLSSRILKILRQFPSLEVVIIDQDLSTHDHDFVRDQDYFDVTNICGEHFKVVVCKDGLDAHHAG